MYISLSSLHVGHSRPLSNESKNLIDLLVRYVKMYYCLRFQVKMHSKIMSLRASENLLFLLLLLLFFTAASVR